MTTISRLKSIFALLTVSVMAATAMPTAASGEPEQSGTLTVTVEVADDGTDPGDDGGGGISCMAPAELTISSSELEAGFLGGFPAGDSTLEDLLYWTFRTEQFVDSAISASFAASEVDRIWEELYADPAPSQIVYSPEDSGIPRTHPADRNLDGILSLEDDMPPILGTASRSFLTDEFEVFFYSGCRFDADDTYGALFTSRTNLEQGDDNAGWSVVEYLETSITETSGFGFAWLVDRRDQSQNLIILDHRVAQSPRDPNSLGDLTAFGLSQTKNYKALIVLRGEIPSGSFRTQFQFQLQVGDPSEIGALDNRMCNWFNQNNLGCFTDN